MGTLAKDTTSGPFAEEWKRVFGEISKDIEEVDIAPALSSVAFSVKGPEELVSAFCSSPVTVQLKPFRFSICTLFNLAM